MQQIIITTITLISLIAHAVPVVLANQSAAIKLIPSLPNNFQRIDSVFIDQNPQANFGQDFLVPADLYVLGRSTYNTTHTAAQLARFTRLNDNSSDPLLVWTVQFLVIQGPLESIQLAGITVNPQPDQNNNDIYITGSRLIPSDSDPLIYSTRSFLVQLIASNGTRRQLTEWTAPLPRTAGNQTFFNETVRSITYNSNQRRVYIVGEVGVLTNQSATSTVCITRMLNADGSPRWNDSASQLSPIWRMDQSAIGNPGDYCSARRIIFAFGFVFTIGQQQQQQQSSFSTPYLCQLFTTDGSPSLCREIALGNPNTERSVQDIYYSVSAWRLFITGYYNNSMSINRPFIIRYNVNGTGALPAWSWNASLLSTSVLPSQQPQSIAYLPNYASVYLAGWQSTAATNDDSTMPFISSLLDATAGANYTASNTNLLTIDTMKQSTSQSRQLVGFAVDARSNLLYFSVWNGTLLSLYRYSPQSISHLSFYNQNDCLLIGTNADQVPPSNGPDVVTVFGVQVPSVKINYALAAGISVGIAALVTGISVFIYRRHGVNNSHRTVLAAIAQRYGRI